MDRERIFLIKGVPTPADFDRTVKPGTPEYEIGMNVFTGIQYLNRHGVIQELSSGGGGTPSSAVVAETGFGQATAAGVATTFSRGDHSHGTPTDPVPAHVGAADPHPSYALDADLTAHVAAVDPHTTYALDADLAAHAGAADPHPAYALDTDLSAHVAAADPHTGYQRESEKNAASGYPGLDASSKIAGAQVTYGSAANTACQGNDARLSDDRTASGVRTATTVVSTSAAAAPSAGQVLTATGAAAATWQTPASSAPAGVLSDLQMSVLNADFTLAAAAGVQAAFPAAQDAFTVQANTTYRVRGQYIINTGATSHTTAMAWALASATVASFEYLATLWSAALNTISTALSVTHVSGAASKVLNAASIVVYTIVSFEGIVRFTAGGTVTPQINFSANPTGTNLMKRGSWVSFERLGADTVTTIGGFA